MTIYVSVIYKFDIIDFHLVDSDLYISKDPDLIKYYLYKTYIENKTNNEYDGRVEKYTNLAKYKGEDELCETRTFVTIDGQYEINTFKIDI